jgi:hypothetical protein
VACVDIPAGTTSLPPAPATAGAPPPPISFTGANAFPASNTQDINPLQAAWKFSPTGQDCTSSTVQCSSAGITSSEVFVTLNKPLPMSEPEMTVMPLTAVKLAIGAGGATSQLQAFQNTWQQFLGPANVKQGENELHYYDQNIDALNNALDTYQLLTQVDSFGNQPATQTGQCGSWAHLLIDALAVNGLQSTWTNVGARDGSYMVVGNWTPTGTESYSPPFALKLQLPTETYGPAPTPPNVYPYGMVPVAGISGDLSNGSGAPGQNSPTPAEKVFGVHFIVQAPDELDGVSSSTALNGVLYYDPSYGITYGNTLTMPWCDFETHLAGYAKPLIETNSSWTFEVEQAAGCNIGFQLIQTLQPSISPTSGTYTGSVTAAISDTASGTTIYYTTDGTTPTTSSPIYTGPFTLTASGTVQAIATSTGALNSIVVSTSYTITH